MKCHFVGMLPATFIRIWEVRLLVPEEVEEKEFVVGVRGFVREEVKAYLRLIADELRARDERIARLESMVAHHPSVSSVVSGEIQRLLNEAEHIAAASKLRTRDDVALMHERASELVATVNESHERLRAVSAQMEEALASVASVLAELPGKTELRVRPIPPVGQPLPEPPLVPHAPLPEPRREPAAPRIVLEQPAATRASFDGVLEQL